MKRQIDSKLHWSALLSVILLTATHCNSFGTLKDFPESDDDLRDESASGRNSPSPPTRSAHISGSSGEIHSSLDSGRLITGMGEKEVRTLYGEPEDVQVAGDLRNGNEKWIYSDGVSSKRWNLSSPRVIYFEEGKVIGWENIHARRFPFEK